MQIVYLFNLLFENIVEHAQEVSQSQNIDNITKTVLFKYTENFITKRWKFSDKKILIFFIFLLKT